jgi:hypothetical protein
MHAEARQAYPLDWPAGQPRTPAARRKRAKFKAGFTQARDETLLELGRLGATGAVLSTNVKLRRDGLPLAGQPEPIDPGVAVYWTWKGKPYAIACDQFDRVAHNLRAIGLTLGSIRAIDRYGATGLMERAFSGFAALPAPDGLDWRAELGFAPDERPGSLLINSRFRERAKRLHPDVGGFDRAMARLNRARALALQAAQEGP